MESVRTTSSMNFLSLTFRTPLNIFTSNISISYELFILYQNLTSGAPITTILKNYELLIQNENLTSVATIILVNGSQRLCFAS